MKPEQVGQRRLRSRGGCSRGSAAALLLADPGPAARAPWVLLCACMLILTTHTYVTYAWHTRPHSIPPVDTFKCIDKRGALRGLGTRGAPEKRGALNDCLGSRMLPGRVAGSKVRVHRVHGLAVVLWCVISHFKPSPGTSGWECVGGSPSGPGLRVLRPADPPDARCARAGWRQGGPWERPLPERALAGQAVGRR